MKVEILEQKGNYFLWIDDSLWMWDIESERKIQYDLAKEAYGEVLVAGYGLGIVQRFLLQNNNVASITTIENNVHCVKLNYILGIKIKEKFHILITKEVK